MSSKKKKIIPKKHLGQNFLIDPRVQNRILAAADLKPNDVVLEIGLGKGELTRKIAQHVKNVIVIEKDIDLIHAVEKSLEGTNINLIHADILTYPFEKLPDNLKIISNLPYNIATPIIEKVIHFRHQFSFFYMTVQLEHAQRMAARCGTKEYGSFSCFIQYYAEIRKLFKIKNTAFSPIPKVQSCFLLLSFRETPQSVAKNPDFLFGLIRQAFNQRRKMLLNALSQRMPKSDLEKILNDLKLSPKSRAENLRLADFVALSNKLCDKTNTKEDFDKGQY